VKKGERERREGERERDTHTHIHTCTHTHGKEQGWLVRVEDADGNVKRKKR
jgi:hypothetical protein